MDKSDNAGSSAGYRTGDEMNMKMIARHKDLKEIVEAIKENFEKAVMARDQISEFLDISKAQLDRSFKQLKKFSNLGYLVSCFLEELDNDADIVARLITEYEVYPLLIDCLVNGNEQVAVPAMDAIKKLAYSPKGLEIIFPSARESARDLRTLALQCSSLMWDRTKQGNNVYTMPYYSIKELKKIKVGLLWWLVTHPNNIHGDKVMSLVQENC